MPQWPKLLICRKTESPALFPQSGPYRHTLTATRYDCTGNGTLNKDAPHDRPRAPDANLHSGRSCAPRLPPPLPVPAFKGQWGIACRSRGEPAAAPSALALAAGAIHGNLGHSGTVAPESVEVLGGGGFGDGGPCPLGQAGVPGTPLAAPAAGAVVVPVVAQAAGSHHGFHGSLLQRHSGVSSY